MKRGSRVLLGLSLVAASVALGACSEEKEQYDQICVDQVTMVRQEEKECEPEHGNYHWYYVPYHANGASLRPVGSVVGPSGSFVKPATGSFSRGGFGGVRGGSGGG